MVDKETQPSDPRYEGLYLSGLPPQDIWGVLVFSRDLEFIEARPGEVLAPLASRVHQDNLNQADNYRAALATAYGVELEDLQLYELSRETYDSIGRNI